MSSLIPRNWGVLIEETRASVVQYLFSPWNFTSKVLSWCAIGVITGGISIYAVIKIFFDWFIDDYILFKRISIWRKDVGGLNIGMDPAKFLEKHAKTTPNKMFLLFEDERYTYAEVNRTANKYAHALHDIGLSPDKPAAIFMKNRPELLFAFYGCLRLTVPMSMINTNLRTKALLHCIQEGGVRYLILDDDPELQAAASEIADDLAAAEVRVLPLDRLSETINKSSAFSVDNRWLRDVDPSTVALYIFTSGTTGLPKAAKISYYRISRGTTLYYGFGVTKDDVLYSPLPLYHSQNLMTTHCGAVLLGATYAFAKKFSVRHFWEDCDRHGATVMAYIGETCRYLLTRPPSVHDTQHKVRIAIGNGLRSDIWNEFKSRFNISQIGEFFAATEGNVGTLNLRNKFGSCGRISPLCNMVKKMSSIYFLKYDAEKDEIVRNEHGFCVKVALGEAGLLVSEVNEIAQFDGYVNQIQTEKKIIRNVVEKGDMYFNTGDLLLRDKDYYVYFVDRIGDTFRWKGENVSTQEVANVLTDLDFLQDCTVYGVSVPHMDGRCGMAAIVLKPGVKVSSDILKKTYDHTDKYLPSYARPLFVRFMPELHLTGTYKHQKFNLKKEGFDLDLVPNVYVVCHHSSTYIKLERGIYEKVINGS